MTNERTVSFAVWPHLITMEGPAATLAGVLEAIYNDPRISRSQWSLANTDGVGRRAMAGRLRAMGKLTRRVGIAALTTPLSEAIERRVRASNGVRCMTMHMPTMSRG